MYSFISPEGTTIKTKTIKEFSDRFNLRYSNAKTLACGLRTRLNGFCSTHPRAKKARKRFMTALVNTKTKARSILGATISGFAKAHGLCKNTLCQLINGYRVIYRDWALETTLMALG